MTEACCKISEIKAQVEQGLSSYFKGMSSGEFAGQPIYPDDILELINIFLSISANHGASDIIKELNLNINDGELAERYARALNEIRKDDYLVTEVSGLATYFKIPNFRGLML